MEHLILVVDDEPDVAETVARTLRRVQYEVLVVHRGADALEIARQRHPDLVILDIMMPGMSGIEVCQYMRANPELAPIPILFLTARGELNDRIMGFESGADDYLTKPFDLRELTLRAKALLRRSQRGLEQETSSHRVSVGDLVLDRRTFEISTTAISVLLTPVEFELMNFLMANPGRVYSTDQLLQQVWGYPQGTGMPDLVRVHIKNIRDKIEPEPADPMYLRNSLRRGYYVDESSGSS